MSGTIVAVAATILMCMHGVADVNDKCPAELNYLSAAAGSSSLTAWYTAILLYPSIAM